MSWFRLGKGELQSYGRPLYEDDVFTGKYDIYPLRLAKEARAKGARAVSNSCCDYADLEGGSPLLRSTLQLGRGIRGTKTKVFSTNLS